MEPITRKEKFLQAAIETEPETFDPVTRIEKYLDKIAGSDVVIPTPVARTEKYLAKIARYFSVRLSGVAKHQEPWRADLQHRNAMA